MDEEDMVEPNVSTLDILKAQHARKAAARHQAEEDKSSATESESSETESELEKPLQLPDFFDDADLNLPPPLHFKDVIRNTRPSTPWPRSPLTPTSAAAGEANQNLPPALHLKDVTTNTRPSIAWPRSPLTSISAAAGEANPNLPPAVRQRCHKEHLALHPLASESSHLNFSCCR